MKELVFLLEERSAKAMLESLIPRILNDFILVRYIPFEGKQDLEKQLIRRIRAYKNPDAFFIIMRDQDSHPDCSQIKNRLMELCRETGKADKCLVRIACRELESMYLADLDSVEKALGVPGLAQQQNNKKFRTPDELGNPSQELQKITKNVYQKVSGSRSIGCFMSIDNTRSPSFKNLMGAIRRWEGELLKL